MSMKSFVVQAFVFIGLFYCAYFLAVILQQTDSLYATNIFLFVIAQLIAIAMIELGLIIRKLNR